MAVRMIIRANIPLLIAYFFPVHSLIYQYRRQPIPDTVFFRKRGKPSAAPLSLRRSSIFHVSNDRVTHKYLRLV